MARLGQWGAELGHEHAEGLNLTGTTLTLDTTTKRTGTRSFKFDASAGCYLQYLAINGTLGRSYYACGHFLIPAASGLPGANTRILTLGASAGTTTYGARLTTAGKLQLVRGTGTQVGSDSSATITTDTWYRVELMVNIDTGAVDSAELRLDGVTVASESGATLTDNTVSRLSFGWVIDDPGTSEVIFWDDLAVNDDQGSVNNSWIGDQKVYALMPTIDALLNNWVNGAGGTTNLFDAVDNLPPTGVSTATSGATNQVENSVSAAADAYRVGVQTYTDVGIGAGDVVTALFSVVEVGSSSTTGTDTLTHRVFSNPAGSDATVSCDIVAGTYPTSWIRGMGAVVEHPTVVKGDIPVLRIAKDIATTRINSCCLMAMVVAVSPGVAPTGERYRSIMMVG